MVLKYIKKIRHSMLCMTGVYLRDVTSRHFFANFALESESSEHFFLLLRNCGGGGGGFFLACEDFGERVGKSFPACVFLLLMRSSTLWQDRSTVAQRAETTVDERSLKSCLWAVSQTFYPSWIESVVTFSFGSFSVRRNKHVLNKVTNVCGKAVGFIYI